MQQKLTIGLDLGDRNNWYCVLDKTGKKKPDSVDQCVVEVLKRTEAIDLLVNNAGVWHVGIAEETSSEDAYSLAETNFFGIVRTTNAVLPGMRKRKLGRIINVGSLAAWAGETWEAFYSASKRALAGYTEALRYGVWDPGYTYRSWNRAHSERTCERARI